MHPDLHFPPISALLSESDTALFLDYYQLTMGQANFINNNNATVTANYYVRTIPQGEYLIAAGLEQVIHYVLHLQFSDEILNWLLENGNLNYDYLQSLKNFRFDGSIYAVPEGTLVFPNEPIINVTGSSRDIQLFETYLLCVMNFQTLIATKASRLVYAAQGKPVYDFGARRAHGRDAGILAARASYIGGVSGTSLVQAGRYFNIPFVGTMSHKFVLERKTEIEAFRNYANVFPHNTTLLIDTYDTIEGAKNACIVAHEMEANGAKLQAVRLDSGNLLILSNKVRSVLDSKGLNYVKIVASHELDEFYIQSLLQEGAPIDSFGVGTRLSTGDTSDVKQGGVAALGGVYKLVEKDGVSVGKLALDEPEKATLPGRKQVYRYIDSDGFYSTDIIALWDEPISDGETLLIPIVKDGELVYNFPHLKDIQEQTNNGLSRLREAHKGLNCAEPYKVKIHPQLTDILNKRIR
ncbi:nicotinate phosphoribosyltransferase [Candidatus Poribacteria bacterium]|nr:MAG: nicotinate phosphoribosyltransferase [Candidatus Poribacteria bacterium]